MSEIQNNTTYWFMVGYLKYNLNKQTQQTSFFKSFVKNTNKRNTTKKLFKKQNTIYPPPYFKLSVSSMGMTRRGSTPLNPMRIDPNMAQSQGNSSVPNIHPGTKSNMIFRSKPSNRSLMLPLFKLITFVHADIIRLKNNTEMITKEASSC